MMDYSLFLLSKIRNLIKVHPYSYFIVSTLMVFVFPGDPAI